MKLHRSLFLFAFLFAGAMFSFSHRLLKRSGHNEASAADAHKKHSSLVSVQLATPSSTTSPSEEVVHRKSKKDKRGKSVDLDDQFKYHFFEYLPIVSPVSDLAAPTYYETLSLTPRVIRFPQLLSEEEAEHIIAAGTAKGLSQSGVVGYGGIRRQSRNSSGVRLDGKKDEIIALVERRVICVANNEPDCSDATLRQKHRTVSQYRNFTGALAERMYLLRYEEGQYYRGHLDSFGGINSPPLQKRRENAALKSPQEKAKKGKGNVDRALTVLLYLATLEEGDGGESSFPFARGTSSAATRRKRMDTNSGDGFFQLPKRGARSEHVHVEDDDGAASSEPLEFDSARDDACNFTKNQLRRRAKGLPLLPEPFLMVRPKKGSAVLFYNLKPNGVADSTAIHAGCPVLSSVREKWVATKWLMISLF